MVEICLLTVVTIACGQTTEEPANVTRVRAENVTGTERLAWTQAAADSRELSTFRYAAYVDGVRVELTDVSCEPSTPTSAGFDCSAPLPSMSAGVHALEIATFTVDDDILRESTRSALKVIKTTPAR